MPVKEFFNEVLDSGTLNQRVFKQLAEGSDIPFISQCTKNAMTDYIKAINGHMGSAKELWKQLLIDAICILKINDKREKLYTDTKAAFEESRFEDAFSDNVRDASTYGINDLEKYFTDFVDYESVLYGTDEHYRDHVQHLLQVWALGIGILSMQIDKFAFGNHFEYRGKDFHFQQEGTSQAKSNASEGRNNKNETSSYQLSRSEIWSMWTVIALTHDLGYPIEKTSRINEKARKIIGHFGCPNFEELSYNFGALNGILVEKFLNIVSSRIADSGDCTAIQSKYRDKLAKSIEEFSHGVFSSLLLFKKLTYFLETDYSFIGSTLKPEDLRQFHIRKEILLAIAGHTCPKLYHINLNTLRFLLILCDELQEWGRPCFDDFRCCLGGHKVEVQIKELNFEDKNQRVHIEFNYLEEALSEDMKKYFRDSRFRFMHELLRSAKQDSERNVDFRWKVLFKDKKSLEFVFDSSKNSFEQLKYLVDDKESSLYSEVKGIAVAVNKKVPPKKISKSE
jgi:hypothetical protein